MLNDTRTINEAYEHILLGEVGEQGGQIPIGSDTKNPKTDEEGNSEAKSATEYGESIAYGARKLSRFLSESNRVDDDFLKKLELTESLIKDMIETVQPVQM
jgi:hypothetical protein